MRHIGRSGFMWGQPPSAVHRPKGDVFLWLHCYHETVQPLLDIRKLNIEFPVQGGSPSAVQGEQPVAAVPSQTLPAVRDLTLSIGSGEVLGLVGESGSGKSITSLAIMRLLPPQAAITAAYLHGLAARLAARGLGAAAIGGDAPIGASDVVRALPLAFRAL